MNLYRVIYVYRNAPDAMPQEKVCFVAAMDHHDAANLVNAEHGNEVKGANVHVPNIRLVEAKKEVAHAPVVEMPRMQQKA